MINQIFIQLSMSCFVSALIWVETFLNYDFFNFVSFSKSFQVFSSTYIYTYVHKKGANQNDNFNFWVFQHWNVYYFLSASEGKSNLRNFVDSK